MQMVYVCVCVCLLANYKNIAIDIEGKVMLFIQKFLQLWYQIPFDSRSSKNT